MPNIPQPQRQDEPALTDADLAALLAGTTDAPPGLRPVADVLAALTAEATSMELAGEYRARAEFRRQAGARVPARHARRGSNGLTSRFGVKVSASIAAAAVVLGGGAAAAFANVLPAPIQRLAHDAIGAPTPSRQRELPRPARSVIYGQVVHGPSVARKKPAAHGGPDTKRQFRPRATPTPAPKSTPQGQPHGNPQGKGSHGQHGGRGNGRGHRGDGQGHGHGQAGQDHGRTGQGQAAQGQGSSQAHSRRQGYGGRQAQRWAGRHGGGQHRNAHHKGLHASLRASLRTAWHLRRFISIGPFMDL